MARELRDTRPILRALKPMTLGELRTALSRITEDPAVDLDSIVICEGWNEGGDFVQGCVESVTTEARCEDDDERQAVYLNLLAEDSAEPCMSAETKGKKT